MVSSHWCPKKWLNIQSVDGKKILQTLPALCCSAIRYRTCSKWSRHRISEVKVAMCWQHLINWISDWRKQCPPVWLFLEMNLGYIHIGSPWRRLRSSLYDLSCSGTSFWKVKCLLGITLFHFCESTRSFFQDDLFPSNPLAPPSSIRKSVVPLGRYTDRLPWAQQPQHCGKRWCRWKTSVW